MELEDEPNGLGAVLGRVVQLLDGLSSDSDRAGIGTVECAHEVEKRALAAAGRPGEGDELPWLDPERDVLERPDAPILERLADVLELDADDLAHCERIQ